MTDIVLATSQYPAVVKSRALKNSTTQGIFLASQNEYSISYFETKPSNTYMVIRSDHIIPLRKSQADG